MPRTKVLPEPEPGLPPIEEVKTPVPGPELPTEPEASAPIDEPPPHPGEPVPRGV